MSVFNRMSDILPSALSKEEVIRLGLGRNQQGMGIFADLETDWVFMKILARINCGAAELSECLQTAWSIDESEPDSWKNAWKTQAQLVESMADEWLHASHLVSARECYWRATNYYRAAEYGTPPAAPDFHELWTSGTACFLKGNDLFDPPLRRLTIDFEGYNLSGYFWQAAPGSSNPTLVAISGNEASCEELIFALGIHAIRRGYNFFTFEHPGHRGTVHAYPDCVRRPDMEKPYWRALDLLSACSGVDERIAVAGAGYGAYICARLAATDPRVRAIIPNSPIVDVYRITTKFWGPLLDRLPARALESLPAKGIEKLFDWILRNKPMIRTHMKQSLWLDGVDNVVDQLHKIRRHRIKGQLRKIVCPTLSLVTDEGIELQRQANEFHSQISSKNKMMRNLVHESGTYTPYLNNRTQAVHITFNWLDSIFNHYGRRRGDGIAPHFGEMDARSQGIFNSNITLN